jgi:hypothetical protein
MLGVHASMKPKITAWKVVIGVPTRSTDRAYPTPGLCYFGRVHVSNVALGTPIWSRSTTELPPK